MRPRGGTTGLAGSMVAGDVGQKGWVGPIVHKLDFSPNRVRGHCGALEGKQSHDHVGTSSAAL